jgi:hypothetical protein
MPGRPTSQFRPVLDAHGFGSLFKLLPLSHGDNSGWLCRGLLLDWSDHDSQSDHHTGSAAVAALSVLNLTKLLHEAHTSIDIRNLFHRVLFDCYIAMSRIENYGYCIKTANFLVHVPCAGASATTWRTGHSSLITHHTDDSTEEKNVGRGGWVLEVESRFFKNYLLLKQKFIHNHMLCYIILYYMAFR